MKNFWIIGHTEQLSPFFRKIPGHLYLWKNGEIISWREGAGPSYLVVEDATAFQKRELNYFTFMNEFPADVDLRFIFISTGFHLELALFLPTFFDREPFFLFNLSGRKKAPKHLYYAITYRELFYGLVLKRNYETIALVVPDNELQRERNYWQRQNVIGSRRGKVEVIPVSKLENRIFEKLVFHPACADNSWLATSSEVYLAKSLVQTALGGPKIFWNSLLFYQYRFF